MMGAQWQPASRSALSALLSAHTRSIPEAIRQLFPACDPCSKHLQEYQTGMARIFTEIFHWILGDIISSMFVREYTIHKAMTSVREVPTDTLGTMTTSAIGCGNSDQSVQPFSVT